MVNKYIKFTLACALAVLTALSAQIRFYLGVIPYTFQNFAIILSGLILGKYGFVSQLIYLAMIALGFPASARGGGVGALLGYTAGYLWMFPVSAFIMGVIRKIVWRTGSKRELVLLWLGSALAVVPLYLFGFYIFWLWASGSKNLLEWCTNVAEMFGLKLNPFWAVFFAAVAVFIPQDLLMDHVLALIVFKYIYKLLKERGYDLP